MVKTDVLSKSEIVPQYIDALYERLKIHLHVVIDGDLVTSYLVYNKEFVAPNELDIFEKRFTHRSEEHTSELQSLMRISYDVFCLKKKKLTNYKKFSIYHY